MTYLNDLFDSGLPVAPSSRGAPQALSPMQQSWPPRLPFELALGLDTEEDVLDRHMITPAQWAALKANPLFIREVVESKHALADKGVTFRSKAKVQAEEYLLQLDAMIHDATIDPKVKLEAIRSVVKWAGLEPKEEKEQGGAQNLVQVNINI